MHQQARQKIRAACSRLASVTDEQLSSCKKKLTCLLRFSQQWDSLKRMRPTLRGEPLSLNNMQSEHAWTNVEHIAHLFLKAQPHKLHLTPLFLPQCTCPEKCRCCRSPCSHLVICCDGPMFVKMMHLPCKPYCLVGYSGRLPSKSPPL